MLTLEGRTAVMPGATGHQGAGAVRILAASGMNVLMPTHNPDNAAALIASLPEEQRARVLAISNEAGDEAAFDFAVEKFGSVDVLIPNQGGPVHPMALEAVTAELIEKVFRHQVIGSFEFVRAGLPYLRKSRAGRVILMSTPGARNGLVEEGIADNIGRAGLLSMTASLSRALIAQGITVNCIVKSGLEDDHPPRDPSDPGAKGMVGRIPAGRNGTPDEFGAAVAWLASEEAGYVTGQIVNLSGGQYI